MDPLLVAEIVRRALLEDIGRGDFTTEGTVPAATRGRAKIIAREEGILAGLPVAAAVFHFLEPAIEFTFGAQEGDLLHPGQDLARLSGSLRPILTAERTALNFLQRTCGVATLTAAWVKEIEGYPARLLDTRKTTPGLRLLERYAVRTGGGFNHRPGLDGGLLIKENHIRAAGGIAAALEGARRRVPFLQSVEIEVTTLAELEEALRAGAAYILLDNMDPETMRRAVALTGGRARLEASGGITFENLKEVAATGVDFISCGALTHSYRALDLSLQVEG